MVLFIQIYRRDLLHSYSFCRDSLDELDVSNLVKIKLFVQTKRYKLGSKININTVKDLRQNITSNGQGAFTTKLRFSVSCQRYCS